MSSQATMLRVIYIVFLCIVISDANKPNAGLLDYEPWKEFEEFIEWKKAKQLVEYKRAEKSDYDRQGHDRNIMDPPPKDHYALMARYVVNQAGN